MEIQNLLIVLLVIVQLILATIGGAITGMAITIVFSFGNDWAMKRNIIVCCIIAYITLFWQQGVFNV